jgi:hypothetical protein
MRVILLALKIFATIMSLFMWGSIDGWLQPCTTSQDKLDQRFWLICEITILVAIWWH